MTYIVCPTQKEARQKAVQTAKLNASNFGVSIKEEVRMIDGCTLEISSTPNGRIRNQKTSGWVKGVAFCSRRVFNKIT
jgi:hypothetical protein